MPATSWSYASPLRRFPLWTIFAGMTVIAVQCAFGMAGDAIIAMCFAAYGFAMGWIYDTVIGERLFRKGREVSLHVFARPTMIVASFCFLFPMVFRLYYFLSATPFVRPTVPDGKLLLAMIFPPEISVWLFFSSDAREPTATDLVGGYLIGCTFIALFGATVGLCWGLLRRYVVCVHMIDR